MRATLVKNLTQSAQKKVRFISQNSDFLSRQSTQDMIRQIHPRIFLHAHPESEPNEVWTYGAYYIFDPIVTAVTTIARQL